LFKLLQILGLDFVCLNVVVEGLLGRFLLLADGTGKHILRRLLRLAPVLIEKELDDLLFALWALHGL
jgi:hypothetical protein